MALNNNILVVVSPTFKDKGVLPVYKSKVTG